MKKREWAAFMILSLFFGLCGLELWSSYGQLTRDNQQSIRYVCGEPDNDSTVGND